MEDNANPTGIDFTRKDSSLRAAKKRSDTNFFRRRFVTISSLRATRC